MSSAVKPWNSKTLNEAATLCTQIQERIESVCSESDVDDLDLLPDSLVPTSKLYLIALCFTSVYEILLNDQLIKTGNPKPNHKMQ